MKNVLSACGRDKQTIRNELGREFACGKNIDIQIERVLEKLEEMGDGKHLHLLYLRSRRHRWPA